MNWEKLKISCRKRVRTLYNARLAFLKPRPGPATDLPELNDLKQQSVKRTAINEHLETLFVESLTFKPNLIVELGVGGGESTSVFIKVARLSGARLVSVDLNDRSHVCRDPDWIFVQQDDIAFAREFHAWCAERGLPSQIDVLFIDTSHYFEHTLAEIRAYFPLLAERAKVFFHDTNLGEFFFRQDGSLDLGWDNERGVIRALEVYFQKSFTEKEAFIDFVRPWLIRHNPHCCGLTILEKLAFLA